MELYYGLILKYDEKIANSFYDKFSPYCTFIDDDVIKKAIIFRLINKKEICLT